MRPKDHPMVKSFERFLVKMIIKLSPNIHKSRFRQMRERERARERVREIWEKRQNN